jgi:hypothetical protein
MDRLFGRQGTGATLAALLGILGAVAAAFGVFGRGDGAFVTVTSARGEVYEMATSGVYAFNARQLVAEGVGWDVFTLVVVAPLLLAAAPFVARGSLRATIMALGGFGYFAYCYLEYAVTWAIGPLFPAFVAGLALSVLGLVVVGAELIDRAGTISVEERYPRRRWAALALGMGGLLVVLWAGRIADALGAAGAPQLHGEMTLTVQALDLGLVVPIAIVVALATLRGGSVALVLSTGFAVMFAAMSAAIGSMMISSWIVTRIPAVEPITVFGLAAAASLLLLRPMFGAMSDATRDQPRDRVAVMPAPSQIATEHPR